MYVFRFSGYDFFQFTIAYRPLFDYSILFFISYFFFDDTFLKYGNMHFSRFHGCNLISIHYCISPFVSLLYFIMLFQIVFFEYNFLKYRSMHFSRFRGCKFYVNSLLHIILYFMISLMSDFFSSTTFFLQ